MKTRKYARPYTLYHQYRTSPPSGNRIISVFRKPFAKDFPSLADKVLHVLILKYEGYKYSRNPNAYQVELHCGTQFFGPIVVALNMVNPPYSLCDFTLNDLKELQIYNGKLNKNFPMPASSPIKPNHISSTSIIRQ
jgi:hypothetical protein